MKKIVILSAFLSPFRSGAEACAEEVPLKLRDGYDFVIITAKMRSDLPKHDLLQGKIPVIRVGVGVGIIDKWLYPFLASHEAKNHNPDLIHAILETFAGLALLKCGKTCPNAKRILTCQTTNRKFLKGPIVRSPDAVTAISNHLADEVRKIGRDDVVVIPNGIDLFVFEEARKKYAKVPGSVLFVGRLEKMKGVDVLLRAFANVQTSSSTLTIVGEGSQRPALKALRDELGLKDRVTFAGYIPHEELPMHYAKAQVFCGLSRSEALGNVFLEAQAAGCAVVATNVGGIRDIVGSQHQIIESGDNEAATSAIQKALQQKVVLSDLSAFDWSPIAARYGKLYDIFLSRTSAAA